MTTERLLVWAVETQALGLELGRLYVIC
uniref:Uncharacterized protein n=1 Tax=Anguilla anguilla TaxID=7936 RepID=A0A0E9PQ59_ANGAN